ncbi:MAG: hypothetical protein ACRD0P_27550, partial [Stackebrandtia sp.]
MTDTDRPDTADHDAEPAAVGADRLDGDSSSHDATVSDDSAVPAEDPETASGNASGSTSTDASADPNRSGLRDPKRAIAGLGALILGLESLV